MKKIEIKTTSLPGRCEVCHQSDQFDPNTNICFRCQVDNDEMNEIDHNESFGNAIVYKDFLPKLLKYKPEEKILEFEPFPNLVKSVNVWTKVNDVNIINIETLVLPNIFSTREHGSGDTCLITNQTTAWHQIIRVWYRPK